MEETLKKIKDPDMMAQIDKIVKFHGHLSTGAFIGLQMLNIARKILKIKESDKVYVTCETFNCLPDPFQILCGCTIGNKGLKVLDYDKMAMTINKAAESGKDHVQGIRIILDPKKTVKYPVFHAWYMNESRVSHEDAILELIKAGDDVYTWEYVDVPVPVKSKKDVGLCHICGESFVKKDNENICQGCSSG